MNQLVIAEPAARDLAHLVDYIAFDNAAAAQGVYAALVRAAERLIDFPALGRTGRLAGTRELTVPNLPYMIVYETEPDIVTILAIFHTSRDLAQALRDRSERG